MYDKVILRVPKVEWAQYANILKINLGETTKANIDQMLEMIYGQGMYDPEYLFVAEKDHEPLTEKIIECTNFCGGYGGMHSMHEMGILKYGLARIYINQTTGKLMHLASLPKLEQGTVIVGFFEPGV